LDQSRSNDGITSDSATYTGSGTSFSAPHVAGGAGLYLSAHPSAAPATVNTAIVNAATTGVVTSGGTGSPNRLLYTATLGS
jgi:subtilisin family serine protease